MQHEIQIEKDYPEAEQRLALIVAGLVKAGILFKVIDNPSHYAILMNGGY